MAPQKDANLPAALLPHAASFLAAFADALEFLGVGVRTRGKEVGGHLTSFWVYAVLDQGRPAQSRIQYGCTAHAEVNPRVHAYTRGAPQETRLQHNRAIRLLSVDSYIMSAEYWHAHYRHISGRTGVTCHPSRPTSPRTARARHPLTHLGKETLIDLIPKQRCCSSGTNIELRRASRLVPPAPLKLAMLTRGPLSLAHRCFDIVESHSHNEGLFVQHVSLNKKCAG